jgi:DNA gyrase subunit B
MPFFGGNKEALQEAVKNYNHKIKYIEKVEEKTDVYDIEVPNTHNFALASGIFVHNSAKQGRDRRFQAILPIKGKILNVEKSRLDKVLSNEEIRVIITALGTSIGEGEFNIAKLRYNKLIIMTDADVDGSHIRTLLLTFLYRQMTSLVEQGHVYIAQPPLYKIKRGKREEYIETEGQMSQLLLELGREGLSLVRSKDKHTCTDNQFKELLNLLVEIENLAVSIERKGVSFSKYLDFIHPKTKKMPIYMVKVEGEDQFVYTDEELAKLVKAEEEKLGEDVEIDGEMAGEPQKNVKMLNLIEFYEAPDLEKLIQKIEKLGFDMANYSPVEVKEDEKKKKGSSKKKEDPIYKIINEKKEEIPFNSMKDILTFVRVTGKKGMTIQRYKGLGEMNPEQLWETTMNPEKRTILQVKLEDAVKADEIFTVLMGDQVEPRRKFIETHAPEVRNLDI